MYLVDIEIFKKFVAKKGFNDPIATPVSAGCILEYSRDNILYAKIEVASVSEFKHLMKYGGNPKYCKFWIRGDEWKVIDNKPVMELSY